MKNLKSLITSVFIIFISSSAGFSQAKCIFQEEGFTQLFNGKNLAGWKAPDGDNGHWSVINGVIDYDARSEAEGDKNLWSEKEYNDFTLHVEWRFKGYGDHLFKLPTILPSGEYLRDEEGKIIEPLGPNSDSGILLKGAGQTNLWCWSVGSGELWSVRNNKDLPAETRAAAVPSSNQDNPVGFWNAFDITVKGEFITIKNNGIVVINNAFYPGLNIEGPIGFQHHGGIDAKTGKLKGASSLVQFRNVWIKEL
ncbi:MAG: DUF1080 domain-containing protein [Prolixibacteraceae bacterium]|nr:DUF1080 domain-containing protein [Prolixibacteraceae bacterium]MBT6005193.1 DUF1080 domain-containing protein [Prolixibacteraceae bacterium]MBT6766091.1 DUF1080 domain-containing protein [Prolixibacteraceae bacterium]MBT6996845.1 DUF1080 domain-containing protein [Prolixibacteraceae bacterium]MBT7395272.1 DUF1080 domain-containing protein [Prolixibacteraceae bacterium]